MPPPGDRTARRPRQRRGWRHGMAIRRKRPSGDVLRIILALAGALATSCGELDSSEKKACASDADCLNGYSCESGTCLRKAGDCAVAEKLCDGECVSKLDPDHGCGQEGCDPCAVGEGVGVCDTLFRCRVDECDAGFKECSGACVPTNDPATGCAEASCDPCPSSEGAAQCTAGGRCGYAACADGTKLCDGQCIPYEDPKYGCASEGCEPCALPNSAGIECVAGECTVSGCKSGFKLCEGSNACVALTDTETGCGNLTSCSPCLLPHAMQHICASGACYPSTCARGYSNCDGLAANGCETNTAQDPDNCNVCGEACPPRPNTSAISCVDGGCQVGRCDAGYLDCNGFFSDGCEVNRLTDSRHCGACAAACETGQSCVDGICN